MSERCFIHPHDFRYLVIDTLDKNGKFVRTKNILNPYMKKVWIRKEWI